MHLANGHLWYWVLGSFLILMALIIVFTIRKNRLIDAIFSKFQQNLMLSNMNRGARLIRVTILIIALFLISFSVLDPRWGTKKIEADMEGIDIIIVMDISRSMLVPDVVPNRLESAKRLSFQLMSQLIGNRIGITAFAGFGFNVIPLTTDVDASTIFLNELSPDMVDIEGTNLEDAIKKAMELFEKNTLTHKAIVIFTDGEDIEFDPMKEVKAAKERGIFIFTVGLGTPNGGKIPLYDAEGNITGMLKDGEEEVTSQLNEALLTKIAANTEALYVQGNETEMIRLAKRLNEIQATKFGNNMFEFMEPQFQYFLLMGLMLLFIYLFLPERRVEIPWKRVLPVMVLIFYLGNTTYASEGSLGVDNYRKNLFEDALKNFQKAIIQSPTDPKLRYNQGNTYYQMGEFDSALSSYVGLTNSENKELRNRAAYNMGNAYLQKKDFSNALYNYKNVLDNTDMESELFQKALRNFIYAKQQQKEQQQQQDQQKEKQDPKNQDEDKNPTNQNQTNNQNQKKEDPQKASPRKPITPSEVENLLNLIEEEEKKNQTKKEAEGLIIKPKKKW